MSRTRLTFFAVLAMVMSIVAVSLATQVLAAGVLIQIYIACSVFALGVTALDFIGIFGHESTHGDAHGDPVAIDGSIDGAGDGAIDGVIDGPADGVIDGSADGGDVVIDGGLDSHVSDVGDMSNMVDVTAHDSAVDLHGPGEHIEGSEFDAGDVTQGGRYGHVVDSSISDLDVRRSHMVLSALAYLRMTVYFCLGFGPTGWAAWLSGYNLLAGLAMATGVGVAALFLAQAFFRFQRSDTDSSLHSSELLRQPATVTVPLTHQTMGKVRIQIGMNVTEQYALAQNELAEFNKGDNVYIMRVTDECVYVA
ncbi:hypothetical protein KFU94_40010 [Chloroflexi bacterium TSY]|nr:hypothetical protein [Chloroflexi bacterium TSY]